MKFGLFYEHQLPKPPDQDQWDPDAEHKLMKNALDQIELADQLGFDYVFEVEHHFLEEYAHSTAPEVFLAAASQRTKNIRLGHGIALMPPRYNHPARVAERIATLDLVSDGRVEFGTGESASEMEMGGFGVDREEKKLMWEEATRECVRMMTETPYRGYEGAYFGMPAAQRHPQAAAEAAPAALGRVVAARDDDGRGAARHGLARLRVRDAGGGEGARRSSTTELVREECMPIGKAINPALGVLSSLMCCDTDEEAIDEGRRRARSSSATRSAYYYYPITGGAPQAGQDEHLQALQGHAGRRSAGARSATRSAASAASAAAAADGEEPEDEVQRALWRAAQRGGCIGTPDFIRDTLLKYEAAHLDTMIFVAQSGARKHEDVMDSIYRTGTQVLPEFKERHDKHQKWRAKQLAGVEYPINSSI